MFCQRCGTKISENMIKCPHCGGKIFVQERKPMLKLYIALLFVPILAIPYMWIAREDIDKNMKKKLSIAAGIWFLIICFAPLKGTRTATQLPNMTTQSEKQQDNLNESTSTNSPRKIEVFLNENLSTTLPQGTEVTLEGMVEAGNGRKANRSVNTGFGKANAQPLYFEIKNIAIWVLLAEPSDKSLFEQTIKIKGKIDYEVTDPIVPKPNEKTIVITDAVIIK